MSVTLDRIDREAEVIEAFLASVAAADGFPPLSEHKAVRLGGADDARVAAWGSADGELVAVSVAALHEGDDPHWAVEVALGQEHRTDALEQAAIIAAASSVPDMAPHSIWARRLAQITAADAVGYRELRRVLRMEGAFPPAGEASEIRLATIDAADDVALIALHNRAFAGHREASGMTRERLEALRAMPWFDADGVLTAFDDGRLVGFCWTKLHPDGDGEVYLLAIDPEVRGRGIGETLASAAFDHLRRRGAQRAMLWVDADNDAAIALYGRLGLEVTLSIAELG